MRWCLLVVVTACGPDVTAFDPVVRSCLANTVPSWRFSRPMDRDGEPVSASFELALAATP